MTVPSWQYLLLFLPAAYAVHALLNRTSGRASTHFLIAVSLVFYALVAGFSVLVLLGSVLCNGILGWLLLRPAMGRRSRVAILSAGVVLNVLLILAIRGATPALGVDAESGHALSVGGMVFVSIGVSFFSLQQIAFLFDCHRRVIKEFRPSTFCLTSVFFPHLLAGPIVRYRELAGQIEAPPGTRAPQDHIAMGLTLLTVGLAKHVIFAQPLRQYLAPVLDESSGIIVPLFPEAAFILISLTLFIYFDFSAYSDMACGAACLLGYRMPVNFLSPLRALNAAEFWRRWHITLSRFMRDYVFLPVNAVIARAMKRRGIPLHEEIAVVTATMITFLIMALWHGVGATFVAWGLSVGVLVSIAQLNNLRRARLGQRPAASGVIRRLIGTTLIIFLTLSTVALFTCHSLEQAWQMMRGLVGLNGVSLPKSFAALAGVVPDEWIGRGVVFHGLFPASGINFGTTNASYLMLLCLAALIGYCAPNVYQWMAPHRPVFEKVPALTGALARMRWRPVVAWAIPLGGLAIVALGILANRDGGGFVYFGF